MIRHTATEHAPWYVVPADNKWFTRLVVAAAVVDALKSMKLAYPKVDREQKAQLEAARKQLLASRDDYRRDARLHAEFRRLYRGHALCVSTVLLLGQDDRERLVVGLDGHGRAICVYRRRLW